MKLFRNDLGAFLYISRGIPWSGGFVAPQGLNRFEHSRYCLGGQIDIYNVLFEH